MFEDSEPNDISTIRVPYDLFNFVLILHRSEKSNAVAIISDNKHAAF